MTPVGVFFICQNEDKCHFVNSTKMCRFQHLRAILSVEWDKVDPEWVIKQPGYMQLQGLFSDHLFGSVSIVVVRLPFNEGLEQSRFSLAVDQCLSNLTPRFFLDFSEVGLYP